jgi:hypothetical protein
MPATTRRPRITLTLAHHEYRALAQLAEREDRPVLLQAWHLIRRELVRQGLLPEPHQRLEEVRHDD